MLELGIAAGLLILAGYCHGQSGPGIRTHTQKEGFRFTDEERVKCGCRQCRSPRSNFYYDYE